jgi:hypothetical protein
LAGALLLADAEPEGFISVKQLSEPNAMHQAEK